MVMELCSGGYLYTRDPYTEDQAARIVSGVINAVGYMHEHNIIHRDLKYENVMFVNNGPKAEIKYYFPFQIQESLILGLVKNICQT